MLGVPFGPITLDEAITTIQHWIAFRIPNYVCVTGAHGVIESKKDPKLRSIHEHAGLVTPDGMPIVWMCRALGFRRTQRVYGPDLMDGLCSVSCQKGYRHFFYGGGEGVAEILKKKLIAKYEGLKVVGTHTPPFRPLSVEEDDAIVADINAAQPDIVWVGISTPKQQFWMSEHFGQINAPVLIGVGAAFDFHAGLKKQAPVWMQRGGLEWLYRLFTEPRRLWRRYLSVVPSFVILAAGQLVREKNRAHHETGEALALLGCSRTLGSLTAQR